ncbi:MAG: peptidyl-prolyl cis-trans isomerase [Nitrospirota bacterium]
MNSIRLAKYTAPALILGLLFFACKKKEGPQQGSARPGSADVKIVATVDGDPITLGEFLERFTRAGIKPDRDDEMTVKTEFLNRLIERKMMLREAQRKRIKVGLPELNARIETFRSGQNKDIKETLAGMGIDFEKWKADIWEDLMVEKLTTREVDRHVSVSGAEIRRYYQANASEFDRPEQVQARQIVVSTEEEARTVLEALRNKTDFAALAKQKSTAPEAANGGDLGYFAMGEMPAEFNVVFRMPKGAVSGVVKSPYGFHIFKLEEKRSAGRRSLEEVTREIHDKLLLEKQETRHHQWLKELRTRAKFEVNYQALEQ